MVSRRCETAKQKSGRFTDGFCECRGFCGYAIISFNFPTIVKFVDVFQIQDKIPLPQFDENVPTILPVYRRKEQFGFHSFEDETPGVVVLYAATGSQTVSG